MKKKKTCFLIRLGAIGDIILITPVLQQLKADGYETTLLCKGHARPLLKHTNLVDHWIIWTDEYELEVRKKIGDDESQLYTACQEKAYELAGDKYDKIIGLSGIVEGQLMKKVWEYSEEFLKYRPNGKDLYRYYGMGQRDHFRPPHQNHVDALMGAAGYPDVKGKRPVWKVSPDERHWAKKQFRKWGITEDNFVVLYQLTGSGIAKTWPYAPDYAKMLIHSIPEARMITLGIGAEEVLCYHWEFPWVIHFAKDRCPVKKGSILKDENGEEYQDYQYIKRPITFRQDGALVDACDVYVGPDTSFLHVAGALGKPNIPLYTVTDHEAIGKYYPDTYPVHSAAKCSPCGLLLNDCDRGPLGAGKCMEDISPKAVMSRTMEVYEQWRERKKKTA